ncbi:MAG: 30S ribosomal protein S5 [Candidatus Buchananbacteria bacterium RIFCSPHIGHO2_02_FULL_40_13]|uniref:Small ribosomal subunit protein uS5 n=1 Tax=Candidatus Buchananbacteria bacterium RIFCSPLOWO2_01_FULL_39_33 TaxID=1797543 RepID=A0A1G1YL31_9BACT|nr:MAG: 30S ribosomal protein S5 [Candidatus Buchananbacteria bacterium RIFCSPHIGHO2_01_FULL_40_35]OGY50584.1 MAG: 30S ribosomal protein S5 [Candidatus Buchananbacteria bacterium RIFCSPHIGHO2_02_FULL_40_13]OGY53055.1 MAG: 30S ribosomal protein S5 [Candidatus Buchananbacteria bacterium RIFCSPLOWO2_01_FULL_39_33]
MSGKDTNKKKLKIRKEQPEFEQQIVDLARVTRVMAGGKRMRFRACVVIGDKKGQVGVGLAKGRDVALAVEKAVAKAEKNLTKVNLVNGTIPHEIYVKVGAAKVLLKPAPAGTGIIAGGASRLVLELAGVKNVVSKIMGTNNKISNVDATIKALSSLKKIKEEKIDNKEDKNIKIQE